MIDDFVARNLPPRAAWPDFAFDLPGLAYPERLNAAVELVDRAAAEGHGGRVAVQHDGGPALTYAGLADRADRIARLLVEQEGLVSGNRVLLLGPNGPQLIAAWLGILKAGGVAVTVMPMLRGGEIAAIVAKAEVSHAIVDARCAESLAAMHQPVIPAKAGIHPSRGEVDPRFRGDDGVSDMQSTLHSVLVYDTDGIPGPLEARLAALPPGFAAAATGRDDPALIAFTSGTTGVPKGCVHFHRDILACADSFAAHVLAPRPGEVWCGTPPLAFTFGLGALAIFPLRFRGTAVTLGDASPPALLAAIARHRVTKLFTAPTAYRALLAHGLDGHDLSSLAHCISAGEHLPEATWRAWHAATGLGLVNGIGATEMMHIFVSASGGDIRPGATGRAVPGYTACVLDAANRPLTEGTGRLAVRGPTGCRYLGDARQADYVVGGWNVTGDTYRLDAQGYFWYLARADDMIVSSGYNIAPPEVEAALLAHPAVAECAVIGVPDEARGMLVKAVVVAACGHVPGASLAKALQDHVKAAIAPYKYPRAVEFRDALPRTATGKLQRHRLREEPR